MRHSQEIQHRKGLAAVELGLLLPIVILFLLGVMDAARLYWTQSVVRDAAFEGARMAILHETSDEQVKATVIEELLAGGLTQSSAVTIGLREPEQPVEVKVTVPFKFLVIPMIVPSMSGTQPITASAVMTHER